MAKASLQIATDNVYIAHLWSWDWPCGWTANLPSPGNSRMLTASGDLGLFRNRCSKTFRKTLELLRRLASKWRALRIPDIEDLIASAKATSSTKIPRGPIVSVIVKSLAPRPW